MKKKRREKVKKRKKKGNIEKWKEEKEKRKGEKNEKRKRETKNASQLDFTLTHHIDFRSMMFNFTLMKLMIFNLPLRNL